LPNVIHGSIVTRASTIQPLMVPPQNSPCIYLVDEVNIPQNNLVHLLSLNTQILPKIHMNLNLKFNPMLKVHITPFPFTFLQNLIVKKSHF
jgi:hypothetical protein